MATLVFARKARHAQRRRWSRWARWLMVPALAACAIGLVGGVQLTRQLPAPTTRMVLASSLKVPGVAAPIPWPAEGEGAVAVPALGLVLSPGAEHPVPIASLTKIMTAYVVLRDHPIAPEVQGPGVTIDPAEQNEEMEEAEANDTSVPVQAGEVLSERQLLDGLMVHSANNFADALATWDAGSVPAFVSKMNATAASLGMTATHYADADGIDSQTTSTPVDQLRVASAAMTIPTFAAVVGQPSISLPLAGTITNYVRQIGTDGIVGVKSGFTQAALGCLVLAGERTVAGHVVLVLAAVTGQPGLDPLDAAAQQTVSMLDAAAGSLREVQAVTPGEEIATVKTSWDSDPVAGAAGEGLSALAWPGDTLRMSIDFLPLADRAPDGTRLGTLSVIVGSERLSVPVLSAGRIKPPSLAWRLAHF